MKITYSYISSVMYVFALFFFCSDLRVLIPSYSYKLYNIFYEKVFTEYSTKETFL